MSGYESLMAAVMRDCMVRGERMFMPIAWEKEETHGQD